MLSVFLFLLLIKHSNESDLKEKGLTLALFKGTRSIMAGGNMAAGSKAVGYIVSRNRERLMGLQSEKGKFYPFGKKATGRLLVSQGMSTTYLYVGSTK